MRVVRLYSSRSAEVSSREDAVRKWVNSMIEILVHLYMGESGMKIKLQNSLILAAACFNSIHSRTDFCFLRSSTKSTKAQTL